MAQRAECREHRSIGVMGISPAGVRQDKNRAVGQGLRLQPKADSSDPVFGEYRAIDRDAQQGDYVGAIVFHGGHEPFPAGDIVSRLEPTDPCAGALDDVCQAEPPLWKTPVVLVRESLGHELRLEYKSPEAVRVPGEVMSSGG